VPRGRRGLGGRQLRAELAVARLEHIDVGLIRQIDIEHAETLLEPRLIVAASFTGVMKYTDRLGPDSFGRS